MQGRATATFSTVLVDDEAPALDELSYLLRDFPEIEIVGAARNGLEAVEVIGEKSPALVFLDVQMPGLDGVGVIRKLQETRAPLPAIVLCTAYEQYALEAFRLEVLDYLLKPVERERLAVTVDRAKRALVDEPEPVVPVSTPRTKLLVKSAGRNWIVDANDLIYATIDGGLITVVTTGAQGQTTYRTIEELQSNLDPAVFWRVHRSYLVNINRIREVIPWFHSTFQLRMDDKEQTEVPVSRVQTRRLREMFKL
jgi:two-component system, LytTR family, response regulator LytT